MIYIVKVAVTAHLSIMTITFLNLSHHSYPFSYISFLPLLGHSSIKQRKAEESVKFLELYNIYIVFIYLRVVSN